jgi:hypothetical protein
VDAGVWNPRVVDAIARAASSILRGSIAQVARAATKVLVVDVTADDAAARSLMVAKKEWCARRVTRR